MTGLKGFAVHASQSSFGLHAYAWLSNASTTRIITIRAMILFIGAHNIAPCFLQACHHLYVLPSKQLVFSDDLVRPWMMVIGLSLS